MKRITRDQANRFAFDWRDEPALHVEPGESFEIETDDASSGYFRSSDDLAIPGRRPGFDRHPPLANPIGGPVYLEGARRGDLLVLTIEEILVDQTSWIAVGPGRGPLGQSVRWPELSTEYTTRIFQHEPGPDGSMRGGRLKFSDSISWPITPFVGTFGVAPDREVATSIDGQGAWGGNLDCRHVSPGNRVFLPIFHDGALFYLGDVHASQGDTEFTGTAAETRSTVRLRLELLPPGKLRWPRVETPDSLISLYIDRPLESAVENAVIHLIEWLVDEHGFSAPDAYMLVSTCPAFRINVYQMVRLGKLSGVVGAELPKEYLPGLRRD